MSSTRCLPVDDSGFRLGRTGHCEPRIGADLSRQSPSPRFRSRPDGITDVLARALGQKLTEALGQHVVIENKPGANSQVGTEARRQAAPDGHTLLVAPTPPSSTSPHLYAKLPYDPINDFAPISGLGISPEALVVNPSVPQQGPPTK